MNRETGYEWLGYRIGTCLWEANLMYDRIQHLRPQSFKRKCGVRRETFEKMVEALKPKLTRSGKPSGQGKFKVEDQLLIAMEYWREYRTQFHIGQSWGIRETTVGADGTHV